jgi:hypothetical protein
MSKITESARGEQCLIRIPGVCNRDDSTTVFCHDPVGSGLSIKWPDTEGTYGCSDCHDLIDGRVPPPAKKLYSRQDILVMYYEGARRTRIKLLEKELIKI